MKPGSPPPVRVPCPCPLPLVDSPRVRIVKEHQDVVAVEKPETGRIRRHHRQFQRVQVGFEVGSKPRPGSRTFHGQPQLGADECLFAARQCLTARQCRQSQRRRDGDFDEDSSTQENCGEMSELFGGTSFRVSPTGAAAGNVEYVGEGSVDMGSAVVETSEGGRGRGVRF